MKKELFIHFQSRAWYYIKSTMNFVCITVIMLLLLSRVAIAGTFTNCTELSNNTTFEIVNQNGKTISLCANDVTDPGNRGW